MILLTYRRAVLAALTMALTVAPLHAQRTTDPETAARRLLEQRVSAFDATQRLVTDYRLSVEQSAGILTRVGFVRSQVAIATARTLIREPALAVSSLRAVGYSAIEVREALLSTGGLLNMSCIDPNGYPAVCGPSGGDVATAMGNGAAVQAGACNVNGALANGVLGSFRSSNSYQGKIRSRLLAAGAPARLAEGWDRAFQGAWGDYTGAIVIPGLPWYPTFALYPGTSAPPTPNTPTPLGALPSAGVVRMSAQSMVPRIVIEVDDVALTDAAKPAIDAFADVIAARFATWLATTMVSQVMGSGPVPVRDMGLPVPAGPVVGQCEGTNVLPLASF